jgi:hypothetical protein
MGSQFPNQYNSPGSPWGTAPGVVDGEFKVLNTTGGPAAIYQAGQIKVTMVAGQYNTVQITWPSVAGAVSYSVYTGFSLFVSQAELKTTQQATTYAYQFNPTVPTDLIVQVWVKANYAAAESVYIQSEPANIESNKDFFARKENPLETGYSAVVGDNDYMRFCAAEIRRRAILMIQNDAEEFIVYMRRWSGAYCNCNQTQANLVSGNDAIQGELNDPNKGIGAEPDLSADPQGDALSRCPKCLGTGIIGGYYYGIGTLLRYGNLPPRAIIYKNFAIDLPHNFNTWTVWEPKLHEHDLVRRVKTAEVFEVTNPARGEWRGVPFHQEANLKLLPPGDARYLVTDGIIQKALGQYGTLDTYNGTPLVNGQIARRVEDSVVNGGSAESASDVIIGGGGAGD